MYISTGLGFKYKLPFFAFIVIAISIQKYIILNLFDGGIVFSLFAISLNGQLFEINSQGFYKDELYDIFPNCKKNIKIKFNYITIYMNFYPSAYI